METSSSPEDGGAAISCGAPCLDQLLPHGGLPPGTMIEWIAAAEGCGAAWLSWAAAAETLRQAPPGHTLVILDPHHTFYPPAVLPFGIDASQLLVLRPADDADLIWAADQALRASTVAAVWGPLSANLDDRDARRLQLAAETGKTMGLFVRPASVARAPSFAAVRWLVQGRVPERSSNPSSNFSGNFSSNPSGRQLQVTLLRCRGVPAGRRVALQIDSERGTLAPVPVCQPPVASPSSPHAPSSPSPAVSTPAAAALPLVSQLAHPTATPRARVGSGLRGAPSVGSPRRDSA